MIRKTYDGAYFKALDDSTGEFEAVVSVFGNVDLQGDRVLPGAFSKSLEKWRRLGDPIPVIWSHQWGDPDAHIGFIMPENAREMTAEEGKAFGDGVLGGLYVKGQLDVHKPFAGQVYDLLKQRRVREWSFAYDVLDEAVAKDGANDLKAVDVLEVGPTLKGANPSTFTLGVKSVLEEAAAMDRGLKKITRALDIDSDIGMKMLRDWVHEDITADRGEPVLEMKALRDWVRADLIAQAMKNEPEVGKKMLKDWMAEDEEAWTKAEETKPAVSNDDLAEALFFLASAGGLEIDEDGVKAALEELQSKVDGEKWDGAAAMRSCSTAGDFRKIAFERANDADPDSAAHWTLPHHTSPGAGADDGGVSAALGRLNQTGPTVMSKDAIRGHLERHQGGKAHDEDGNWIEETGDSEKSLAGDADSTSSTVSTVVDTTSGEAVITTSSDTSTSVTVATPPPAKAGRVIGAKAATGLKETLTKAVDDFVAAVNGASQEPAEDEKDEELERAKAELEEYRHKLDLLTEL